MARKKAFEDRAGVIIQAADRLFGQYGFERTTVEEIAREAGISKASVYLEFKTKEEILHGVVFSFIEKQLTLMEAIAAESHANVTDAMRKLLYNYCIALLDFGRGHQYSEGSSVFAELVRLRTPAFEAMMEQRPRILAGMLEQAAGQDEILPQNNYQHLAETIFHGLARICAPPYSPYIPREKLEEIMGDFLDMLLASLKVIQK